MSSINNRAALVDAIIDVMNYAAKPSDFEAVGLFHHKFGLPTVDDGPPVPITKEARNFRLKFLLEELTELFAAYGLELKATVTDTSASQSPNGVQDLPQIADALVDLVYVALGTAHMHRLPWPALFDEVQRANISKKRADHATESKRGSTLDVVKPHGWKAPDISGVLRRSGWSEELEGM